MESNFLLGVNYWASNAGIKMWVNFDLEVIENDFQVLRQNGVNTIRIFPLWSDFQPLTKRYTFGNEFQDYAYEDDRILPFTKEGKAGIDNTMIDRFAMVLKVAKKHSIKVIVGLITGWMSGRIFVPKALINKNLITDPEAIRIQIQYVQYLVDAFKDNGQIIAWDFGNECNCMQANVSEHEAFVWCSSIYNAIYKLDNTRPVLSGMHTNVNDLGFSIKMLSETCDILCTHPYPYFTKHCMNGNSLSFRTLMHSACITSMNADLSGKTAIVEEIGTLGNMFCDNESAGCFAKMNMFETLAQGFRGFLWWCGFDQEHQDYSPYDWFSYERELGILCTQKKPKAIANAMREFSEFIEKNKLYDTPEPTKSAVCMLTKGTDKWSVGYGAYMLARQAGFQIKFCDNEMEIPKACLYLLPSICSIENLTKGQMNEILLQVKNNGAKLYISLDSRAFLWSFKEICGIEIQNVSDRKTDFELLLGDEKIRVSSDFRYDCKGISAKVLATSNVGDVLFCNSYGKGEIYTLLLPLERIVAQSQDYISDEEADNYYKLYEIFKVSGKIKKTYKNISISEQVMGDRILITATNAGKSIKEKFTIKESFMIDEVIRGKVCNVRENVIEFYIENFETVMFYIRHQNNMMRGE